jgi:carbamoyl-phosphate synthase large subunit
MTLTHGLHAPQIKILVSGVGGDTGQGVVKSLRKSGLSMEINGMCIRAESPFLFQVDRGLISPRSASTEYIPFLINALNKYSIDLFIPTVDSEILLVSRNRARIESETKSKVFIGDPDNIMIASDKYLTALFLEKIGVRHPETVLASDTKGINELLKRGQAVVVKPRSGNGSRGVFTATKLTELETYLGREDFVVQEWLDPVGGEYTTGIYSSQTRREYLKCTLLRELRNGSTYIATRVIDGELENPLQKIAEEMDVPYINVQSMKVNGCLSIFEVNPRLSGTTAIVSRVFNPLEMYLREVFLGESPPLATSDEVFVAMRYFEEHYEPVDRVNDTRRSGLTN